MQFEWETLLEQARAHHALARAVQATAEAALLVMRRAHGGHGQDGELDAWFSDAHGFAEVAKSLVRSQGGTKEEYGRHQAHDKASLVCTPPRAGVSKALHACEVYDIGEDGAQNCGGFGVLDEPSTKCMASMLGNVMCERPWESIEQILKDGDCVLPDGVDVGIGVDAMVWALPRPPEGVLPL